MEIRWKVEEQNTRDLNVPQIQDWTCLRNCCEWIWPDFFTWCKGKTVIILTNKIMKLINLGMAYEFSMFGNDRMILYRTVKIFCSNVLPVIMLNPCSLKDWGKRRSGMWRRRWMDCLFPDSEKKRYRSIREKIGKSLNEGQLVCSFVFVDLKYLYAHRLCCNH